MELCPIDRRQRVCSPFLVRFRLETVGTFRFRRLPAQVVPWSHLPTRTLFLVVWRVASFRRRHLHRSSFFSCFYLRLVSFHSMDAFPLVPSSRVPPPKKPRGRCAWCRCSANMGEPFFDRTPTHPKGMGPNDAFFSIQFGTCQPWNQKRQTTMDADTPTTPTGGILCKETVQCQTEESNEMARLCCKLAMQMRQKIERPQ